MFSITLNKHAKSAACAGVIVAGFGFGAASAASAAPAVVVKSSAGEFPVGSKVDAADTITLKGGDSVTVLTKRGTRTMKGPGTFKVGDKPKSNRARFANLTRTRAASRTATGAVRSAAVERVERPSSPNLYYVDVAKSGTMCVYNLEQVRLWRPFNEGIETYTVSAPMSQTSVDVTFDDGESVAPLDPALMSLTEGSQYTITGPDGSEPATIAFANLGQQIRNPSDLATALVDNGCMEQVALMGEKL